MVQRSQPFDGRDVADAGPYSAEQWASMFKNWFLGTNRQNAGVIYRSNGSSEPLDVTETSPASLAVDVSIGAALVNGRYYENTAAETVSITQNTDASGDDRIDNLVVRSDLTAKQIRLAVIQGTPDPAPTAPSPVRTATVFDIEIAHITVVNGATTITNANIDTTPRTYARNWHPLEGGTGAQIALSAGDVLVAQDADQFQKITMGLDAHVLVGNTSLTPPVTTIDQRTIVAYGSPLTTAIGSGFTAITLTTLEDDTGYAALSGGNLRLAVGTYELVRCHVYAALNSNFNYFPGIQFYNASTATVIERSYLDDTMGRSTLPTTPDLWPVRVAIGGGVLFTVTSNTHNYQLRLNTAGGSSISLEYQGDRTNDPECQKLFIRRVY